MPTLSISARFEAVASDAILYDGTTAHRHLVTVEPFAGSLRLSASAGWQDNIDAALLRRFDDIDGRPRLGRSDIAGWRLLLAHPLDPALLALLPSEDRYGRWIDRVGLVPALIVCAVIAGLVVVVGHLAPAWLAPVIPRSWERNLGEAIVGDFGTRRCRNPAGQRALDALVERLEPGATAMGPNQVRIAALDIGLFNAAALPGGHIVLFKGARAETGIDGAAGVDEVAGIVAHEIAHVRRRHVTQALVRELGIGALIRLFAGGIGASAESLVGLSYTRANEAQADADAIAMLKRAAISPRPTAQLFTRLAKQDGGGKGYAVEFLESHPRTGTRAASFAAAFDSNARYRPALDKAQSAALFSACAKPAQAPRR